MTDKELAVLLVEKVADANIDKKVAVYVNRLLLRFHSQPSLLANLADVTVFKPGSKGETTDQVEDGEFNEVSHPDDLVVLQLSFRRLPKEVISPLIRLIAAPREPKMFRYTKDGSARFGVEIKLRANDFPGDEYEYSF